MSILIAYGTIEGQTGKIARFMETALQEQGYEVALLDTSDSTRDVEWEAVGQVILAGSVHEHKHPKGFEVFVYAHRRELSALPTLLCSVSLNAAFPEGRAEAQGYIDDLKQRSELTTARDLLVAGALRAAQYDYYSTQVLQHVLLRDKPYDPHASEHEFTDWDELRQVTLDFAQMRAAHPA